ncbi:MAG: hypothetical protein QF733_01700 [Phycisphaerales bacterium]|jgi:hypothetical protein|nr:hypothetical protein [Phycisphaerales bacterium]
MTNQIRPFLRSVLIGNLAAILLAAGCGEDAPPPPKKETRKAVTQPKGPLTTPVADLIVRHDINDRIWMEDRLAPTTDERRILVLQFFNGFVTGDADAIRPFLADVEQRELDALVASGDLQRLAADIEGVEIQSGSTHEGRPAVIGLFEFADRIEGQMWELDDQGGSIVFRAAPSPPGLCDQLGADPFADWYAVVAREQARMNESDLGIETAEAVEPPEDESAIGGGPGGGGGGGRPGGL